jgi:hypothetical protein
LLESYAPVAGPNEQTTCALAQAGGKHVINQAAAAALIPGFILTDYETPRPPD